ncbi:MAG: flagellar basal-body rod protein FlgG [Candidatus Eisenbacteria bacterium]|uniref:Flagellar basal-body rod protein FlgG n=1 Tax=Eiseniibacteriota bacterium TaxID=2212470 RepID=A0A956NFT2_UNCEI|nr:flagellar basal-body rod protein FlgG [Candidatus Eisenbacteria bacterium]MCB9466342.1 flagellar basal-body rod protein FlgG [Candidatus Eisenbacteria bacterium]
MLRAMRSAASGMKAQQLYLDTVANNLANVNTTGFKRARIGFEDLLYQQVSAPGDGTEGTKPAGLEVGHGSRAIDTQRILSQGDSEVTENPLDLLIQGDGFFQVTRPDGTQAYLRDGSFRLDANGRIVTANGYVLQPEISLPQDTVSLAVTEDGRVFVEQDGTPGSTEIGQILLARFTNPAGLTAEGQNLYRETGASGTAQLSAPGELGVGTMIQGALERSNVQVVEEMIHMIVAQRAFEVNSKAVESADSMMRTAVNMRPA